MRRSGLILSRKFVIGILIWTTLSTTTEALRGSAVVLQAKTKAAEQKEQADEENNGPAAAASATNVTKPQLTGIPQIDYVLDPNLPRELNGHNLTDYPFYNAVPEEINFKCDGLHDGFYASVPHKCQVYHHCLYGTRYDFLCANYTAFDQKTFICHFVSEVDCDNSPKYYKRNEALYKEATTTTTSTTTTTTPSTTTAAAVAQPAQPSNGGMRHNLPRRRRPYRRRRPMYEYYYDDEEYADADYYEDEVSSSSHRRAPYRKHNKDIYQSENRNTETDYDTQQSGDQVKPAAAVRPSTSGSSSSVASVFERPRPAPKIRRPVPKSERDKYDYAPKQQFSSTAAPTTTTTTTTTTTEKPHSASNNGKGGAKAPATDDEYYEDEEEYEYEEPKPAAKSKHHTDYDFPTGFEDTRRYTNRYRGRMPPARKRAEMYDDYDVKERPSRINRRKEYTRYDGDRPRNSRPMHRMKPVRHEEDASFKYPAAKKRPAVEPEHRAGSGRRAQEAKRPPVEDDYYYDEEEPEEPPPKRGRRPQKTYEKPKSTTKHSQQSKERYQEEDERPHQEPPANVKYAKDLTPTPRNGKANTAENEVPKVSPSYNEISTTESVSSPVKYTPNHNQKYPTKTVKIVTNSLKDELDDAADTYPRLEPESRMSSSQTKPVSETPPSAPPAPSKFNNAVSLKTLSTQPAHRPESYSEVVRKEKKPFEYDDGTVTATTTGSRFVNKTIVPVRHFVVSSAPRKPSHFLASLSTPVVNSYRDDSSSQSHYRPEDKPHHKQLPEQQSGSSAKVAGHHVEFYKPATSPQNVTHFAPMNFRNFAIPVSQEQPKSNVRPVKEDHLVPETLNAINNGNFYHTAYITEPKSFANEASKPTAPSQQTYRQDHRSFGTNSDRFYTTNSISFPPRAPSNYDITAPGPSAPGEEPTAPEKKYSEAPTYTASADYDVTYNDALQPSTLHPVRRYPSTSFYAVHQQQQPQQQQQHQQQQQQPPPNQQQQRSIVSSRLPSDYAFNEGAFNSLSRSQSRYAK
ncbi:uncharacterized protein LOC135835730 [Planococcus citri]|uniref:uncharacterized protein LOC135835730 n=1 Tax=Planococcus citri TaxID=170843 RepID=UPI0031F8D863